MVYHPNKQWSIAASIENPEQFVTTATTLPAFAATQVDNGSVPTTPNVRPDIVAKIAHDTQVSGKALHFDLAGFSRQFRTSPAPGKYFDAQGVGGSFNTVLEVAKNFRLIANSFYSSLNFHAKLSANVLAAVYRNLTTSGRPSHQGIGVEP